MSKSDNVDPVAIVMWIVTIILTGVAGILSWNLIEPDSFWNFIVFITLWCVLSRVAHLISMILIAMFDSWF
ncbi:hypothetical protein [Draconibacterium halophilum]|uniref:Uncharacterized protein n=1 Tax=Draconibacterium halophilum TaxID=2706887 RepID=A0A6C0RB00_9BACT|nr:hypothetical protein [Draconibacterium halophilum]QIA07122.1 hypothetical protein G0Q07_04985 [Draconibacterium halophilum]